MTIIQNVLIALRDPAWVDNARTEFNRAQLDFDFFSGSDLQQLSFEEITKLREGLEQLKTTLRRVPPY